MKYKSVTATQYGGPEVLQVVEHELREPVKGEARVRVLAAPVCRPDLTVRSSTSLYAGTPLGQKLPLTPGYAIVGEVDAVGPGVREVTVGERVGALTVIGAYSEYVYWRSDRLFPVPSALDPAEVAPLLLNYIVAYQCMHRAAKVKAGDRVLLVGASGGIGTALLELGKLAGLRMYAVASRSKHAILCEYGALPIDYHTQDYVEVVRRAEPQGIDAVISGVMSVEELRRGMAVLRDSGRLVSFGEPEGGLPALFQILRTVLAANLLTKKKVKLYGTSTYFVGSRKPYLEDWATLFKLLESGKIKPVIEKKYPLLEAAQANAWLESGQVVGNLVLVAPDLLQVV